MITGVSLNGFRNNLQNSFHKINIKSIQTNLPVNIDSIIEERIVFNSPEKGRGSITLKGRIVDHSVSFSDYELEEIRNFTTNNQYALKWLMTTRISVDDFLNVMIKGGDKASEREILLQKEAVDRIVFGD